MERKRGSIPLSALMDIDSLDESSGDSDFRVEDCSEGSYEELSGGDENDSEVSWDVAPADANDKFIDSTAVVKENNNDSPVKHQDTKNIKLDKILICCVCLDDLNNDENEIVECDCCGITVHEDCYGISDTESVSSCDSRESKISWFCDACLAGKENPTCELCPNLGGIFKETDTGLWVHLVCALYIPGVAFRDVTSLRGVTLFEMSYNKWGERACSLCTDQQFTLTGVCIGCDAGLCKTYFHVTCAQKEGLLAEAQTEEINHADPFYAHCKMHSDKNVLKIRRRNWLAFESRMTDCKKKQNEHETLFKSTLLEHQQKYNETNIFKQQPWIPTNKIARPLTSSASTLRALSHKATLSGLDTQALAMKEAQRNALADAHRKWHIAPAFNFDYMGYYLDRNSRITSLQQNLNVLVGENTKLINEQRELQELYNQKVNEHNAEVDQNKKLKLLLNKSFEIISKFSSSKKLPICDESINNVLSRPSVSSLANNTNRHNELVSTNILSINNEDNHIPGSLCLTCAICNMNTDQHFLVNCDTCQLNYHLKCLDPPLTRMPKKTKVVGWQCSECDKTSSDSDIDEEDAKTSRQLRHFKVLESSFKSSSFTWNDRERKSQTSKKISEGKAKKGNQITNKKVNRKKAKKIPHKISDVSRSVTNQNIQKQNSISNLSVSEVDDVRVEENCNTLIEIPKETTETVPCIQLPMATISGPQLSSRKKEFESAVQIMCDACKTTGTKANVVTCDECLKGFHFLCLTPPVKKSPKCRGYSWHCTECDPSESDSE